MDKISPISEALALLKVNVEDMRELSEQTDLWLTFGKMNSSLYRKELMERMARAALSAKEKFMVYFLFSVIKSQPRVLKALDSLEDKSMEWFVKVRAFVDSQLCQYVSQAASTRKFPAVNIPSTNPALDVLCFVVATDFESVTLDNLFKRPTTSQLNLDDVCQAKAKEGYQFYWESIVKGSKNPEAKDKNLEAPKMREEYYENPAADKYNLISVRFVELRGSASGGAFTEEDLENYLTSTMVEIGKAVVSEDGFLVANNSSKMTNVAIE